VLHPRHAVTETTALTKMKQQIFQAKACHFCGDCLSPFIPRVVQVDIQITKQNGR
jgi:hypothetical protein